MSDVSGKQIKLFLVDGTPGGPTAAEITNWTGHVLSAKRSDLAFLLRRDEAQRTGVYLLLGDDESVAGETPCYIGEADVVSERLRSHEREKDFWDRVVVITSKDSNITKAHGRYLESRLIRLAEEAGRVSLENKDRPLPPALPEADASDMDYFLAQLQIVLPVLGVNAIRVKSASAQSNALDSPVFRLTQQKLSVDAQAQQIDGEFTVLAGSLVVPTWHGVGKAQSISRHTMATGQNTSASSPMARSLSRTAKGELRETSYSVRRRRPAQSVLGGPAMADVSGLHRTAPCLAGGKLGALTTSLPRRSSCCTWRT